MNQNEKTARLRRGHDSRGSPPTGARVSRWRLVLPYVFGLFLPPLVHAAGVQGAAQERPRVGLVLSGGGARGIAHIGVIEVLERLHVPIDCIAGTSMGSIVGGLYAAGMTPSGMDQALTAIDWPDVFKDSPAREFRSFRRKRDDDNFLVKAKPGLKDGEIALPKGAIQGQKLTLILRKLALPAANIHDFDRLKVPFRAVATDIGTGNAVVLARGDLALAMRASMSIPSVFAPVELDGKVLVDGFVSNNLPIDVGRELCGDRIIAVDIATPLEPGEKLGSFLSIMGQLTGIMTQQNTARQLGTLRPGDVLIRPDLGDVSATDFNRAREVIPIGEKAAWAKRQELEMLALSPAAYQRQLAAEKVPSGPSQPVIDFIRVANNSRLSNQVIRSRLKIKVGQRLNVDELKKDLAVIYGLENFERVDYRLVQEDGRTGLVIDAVAKSWGPNYLQFGLNLQANGNGESAFNLGAGYLKSEVNAQGGEWRILGEVGEDLRLFTDFYQPLGVEQRYFLVPSVLFERFDAGFVTSELGTDVPFQIKRTVLSAAGGVNLGHWGEFRLGLRGAKGSTSTTDGQSSSLTGSFTDVGYLARLSADTLDNINFPRSGSFGRVEYFQAMKALGSDDNFSSLTFVGGKPYNWGRHTLLPVLNVNATLSGDLPLQDQFFLGGFLNLSGFRSRALVGPYSGLARLIYLYRLDNASTAFTVPMYAGGSIEAGNVWDRASEISFDSLLTAGSLFVGADTPIGPVYVGGGLAEGGNKSFYLFLGRTF
jgi:NTE family protein